MLGYKQVKAMRDAPLAKDIDVLTEEVYELHSLVDAQCEYIKWLQAQWNPRVYDSTENGMDSWCPVKKQHEKGGMWK